MNKASIFLGTFALVLLVTGILAAPAFAQRAGTIELEVIEIESEVPRRVAQFFVQRDRLHYQPEEERPSFLPELLKSVEKEPF